ncbi:hypothetical protein [Streptomyces sp. NBC_01233]|uniref:hypothetical protein n=1 Tax=Streptomyces sp. NBC_01233 TaxID=2903787 RepID=UPI002E0F76E8|nr:hypothetical protein OG332_24230 [Streptomyces sp. NBC_01233]
MKLHEIPILDLHWEGYELGADDTHRFVWIHQGFNLRLLAVPKDDSGAWGYDHAWCYPRDPELIAAAVEAWDSDLQDEPTGWHKRATHPARRAPRRDEAPDGNPLRCHHGSPLAEPCRTTVCHDPDRVHYGEEAGRAS